jgi:hypothetical protein
MLLFILISQLLAVMRAVLAVILLTSICSASQSRAESDPDDRPNSKRQRKDDERVEWNVKPYFGKHVPVWFFELLEVHWEQIQADSNKGVHALQKDVVARGMASGIPTFKSRRTILGMLHAWLRYWIYCNKSKKAVSRENMLVDGQTVPAFKMDEEFLNSYQSQLPSRSASNLPMQLPDISDPITEFANMGMSQKTRSHWIYQLLKSKDARLIKILSSVPLFGSIDTSTDEGMLIDILRPVVQVYDFVAPIDKVEDLPEQQVQQRLLWQRFGGQYITNPEQSRVCLGFPGIRDYLRDLLAQESGPVERRVSSSQDGIPESTQRFVVPETNARAESSPGQ